MQVQVLPHKKTQVIKKLFSVLERKDWIKAIAAILLILIAAVCDLLNPFYFAKMLEIMTNPTGGALTPDKVDWSYLGVMAGLSFGSIITNSASVFLSNIVAIRASAKIRLLTFSKTQYLSASDIDKIGNSSIITRVTADATQIEQFYITFNTIAVKSICFIIGGFTLSIIQIAQFNGDSSIWFTTLSYVFIFVFFGIAGILILKAMPLFSKTRKAVDNNNTIMNENIVGNKLIRVSNLEKNQTARYKKGNSELRHFATKSENYMVGMMPLAMFFINLGILTIYLFVGIYAWDSGTTVQEIMKAGKLIGVAVSFMQYLNMIMLGMLLFSNFGYIFSRARVCGIRVFDIIDKTPQITDPKKGIKIENGNIVLNNVSFAYHQDENGQGKNALSKINLNIPAGTSLGVIGQTGSGKTTLVNLIARVYDVTEGTIKLSGHDIRDIDIVSLRENVAVSLQDKVILHGTIRSNIVIGKHNATDAEVVEAAKNAEAWEFISSKEGQLMSRVEQRGNNLSGGQKQRLSIARTLIKKPKILIFDDSTSALDTITERKIMNNLRKNFMHTTKIIVSQKIKSIQQCDQIIVLDDGKIVQSGMHTDLMKDSKGIYKKIFDSQNTSIEG